MGVLACARSDCPNIMCDLLVDGYYLCWECCEEFEKSIGLERHTHEVFIELFDQFLETLKCPEEDHDSDQLTVLEFLESYKEKL